MAGSVARTDGLPRSKRVLLLVDFINPFDFPGAEALLPGAWRAAQAAAKLKSRLARERVPAIYANDNYGSWHSDFRQLVARCTALPGRRGEIARLLAPQPRDLTIVKPRHSAFFATPLNLLLHEIGARELVIAGLSADMCVQLSAAEAFMQGYETWVPADCTAAESARCKADALEHMRRVMKCSTRLSTSREAAAR